MKSGYSLGTPAQRWEEGILIGNGKMGAIMMGGPHEVLTLTNEKLYAPMHTDLFPPHMAEHLDRIRALLAEGKYAEAAHLPVQLMQDIYHNDNHFWTNPFFPACELHIETPGGTGVQQYGRTLDFATGLGTVTYQQDGVSYRREAFLSRRDGLGVLRLSSDAPACYRIGFAKHAFEGNRQNKAAEQDYHLGEPVIGATETGATYDCAFVGGDGGYHAWMRVTDTDGSCHGIDGRVAVTNAKTVLLLFALEVPGDKPNLEECSALSFDTLLKRHTDIHTALFSRICLQLADKDAADAGDMALWEACKRDGKASPAFLNKVFDAGRYEILSACGDTPPNLQGVWTGTFDVPWSSDYTNNGNVQTAVLGLLPSGMFTCMLSLFDYLESRMADYRYNAKHIYGCRGIHIPSRTSDRGIDFHFSDTWCMLFWVAGAAWMAHFYYDYWLFTRDDAFFVNRALPFMKEAALFYEDYLIEDENGRWLFSPSYSPENHPANSDSQACINATMDIAIATELFQSLITGCATLGIEQENVARWREIVAKMPPYLINEDGALKEWATPLLQDRYDHRHSSHLYMLYYDIPHEIREDRALFDACVKAYELRMEGRKEEKGVMAFGLVQCGMAAAHLRDHKMVDTLLHSMAGSNYYSTFASSHDAGPEIFNADISGGFPALMLEALAQCSPVCGEDGAIEGYEISLLPALPDCMPSGSIKNMRLRGGFALDMQWKDKRLVDYRITNEVAAKTAYTVEICE